MAIDPATGLMLGSMVANLLGGLLAGEDKSARKPFRGFASNGMNVDPKELLGNSLAMLYSTAGMMGDKMSRPTQLRSSYAQPVRGLSGVDPAYNDRSLLNVPGMNFGGGPSSTNNPILRQLGISTPPDPRGRTKRTISNPFGM